jgi:hypothetical protein
MLRSEEQSALNQLENTAVNFVEAVCAIICRPVEMILRPWHGTRYYTVPVIFFSTLLMLFMPLVQALTDDVVSALPLIGHLRRHPGLFGLGSFAKLYFILSFVHGIRLWRRMIHMELESYSEYEGNALPIFQLFPKASFWITRIFIEPGLVLIVATVLHRMMILQSGLATYLEISAFALGMKEFIAWYRNWEFLRTVLDLKNASPILARMVEDRAPEEDLATLHLAGFPKNISPELRKSAMAHIARAFSPEVQS